MADNNQDNTSGDPNLELSAIILGTIDGSVKFCPWRETFDHKPGEVFCRGLIGSGPRSELCNPRSCAPAYWVAIALRLMDALGVKLKAPGGGDDKGPEVEP